jgi:hypothetical protein
MFKKWKMDLAFRILERCKNLAVRMTGVNPDDISFRESGENEIEIVYYNDLPHTIFWYFPRKIRLLRITIIPYGKNRATNRKKI